MKRAWSLRKTGFCTNENTSDISAELAEVISLVIEDAVRLKV